MKQYAILAIALLLVGCSTLAGETEQETVHIGAILILSDIGSDWGSATLNGAQLAATDINKNGGINGKQLEIVAQDNPGDDPKSAISAYNALKLQGINTIIGTTWSTSAWALMPVACEDKTLLFSATVGTPQFTEACEYTFNTYQADTLLSYDLGVQLYESGHRKLAVLANQDSWQSEQGKAVREGFTHAGGTIVLYSLTDMDETDYRTDALKIKESGADAVFFLVHLGYQAEAVQQLRQAGITAPLYTVYLDQPTIEKAGKAIEDTIVATSVTPTQAFSEEYEAAYGMKPTIGADTGYDTVMLIAQAMQNTGSTDPTILSEYLQTVKTYNGASGKITFDQYGGARKEAGYLVVQNGNLVPYSFS
jgi:branched-chain amino acid transport system substrate-binding protein